jgi:hypothetical protein
VEVAGLGLKRSEQTPASQILMKTLSSSKRPDPENRNSLMPVTRMSLLYQQKMHALARWVLTPLNMYAESFQPGTVSSDIHTVNSE